jgi:hypothetical protein
MAQIQSLSHRRCRPCCINSSSDVADIRCHPVPVKEPHWHWRIRLYLHCSSLAVNCLLRMSSHNSRKRGANESTLSLKLADDKLVTKLPCLLLECILGTYSFTYFSTLSERRWFPKHGAIGSIGKRAMSTKLSSGSKMASWNPSSFNGRFCGREY